MVQKTSWFPHTSCQTARSVSELWLHMKHETSVLCYAKVALLASPLTFKTRTGRVSPLGFLSWSNVQRRPGSCASFFFFLYVRSGSTSLTWTTWVFSAAVSAWQEPRDVAGDAGGKGACPQWRQRIGEKTTSQIETIWYHVRCLVITSRVRWWNKYGFYSRVVLCTWGRCM